MSELKSSAPTQSAVIGWTGALLVRAVVPAWIIFGAYQKLQGATPKSLPRSILDAGGVFLGRISNWRQNITFLY